MTYQSPYVVADNNPIFFIDQYGLGKDGKCDFFCRLFNRVVFGKKNVFEGGGNKGRRIKGRSRSTSLVYSPKKPTEKSDDCTDCRTPKTKSNLPDFDFGNSGIGQVDAPDFGPTIVDPLESPERPTPRRDIIFRVPTVAGQSLTTPIARICNP